MNCWAAKPNTRFFTMVLRNNSLEAASLEIPYRSGFKTSDQVQEQGVPRIENGAYTSVREYYNPRNNAAIGPKIGF